MARLEIRLLGPFEVTLDGEPVVDFETNAARALLAYLAAEPGRFSPRPMLAEMLWPDRPEGAALGNLRHVLSVLRRALGDDEASHPVILAEGASLAIAPSDDAWVDLVEFERLASVADDAPEAADGWVRAVGLWRGPLLDGLSVRAGAEWEEWTVITAERLRRLLSSVLGKLADHHERHGSPKEALATALHHTQVDPWDERAHRRFMRLLAGAGERGRALAHYQDLVDVLRSELDAAPEPETVTLARRIRAGDLTGASSEIEIAYPAFLSTTHPPFQQVFVDRETELGLLRSDLAAALAGRGRIALVAGEAGAGKTMLVTEFLRQAKDVSDLLMARGRCSAFGGLGDPYSPFRELLGQLCGEVEAEYASGALDREQATRLWEAIPHSARLVAEVSPSLVGIMVNGPLLIERVERAMPTVDWTADLRKRIEASLDRPAAAERLQPALFDEYTTLLGRLAISRPMVLVIDDVQWADRASMALLWHLVRRIEGLRLLLVLAFRPEDVVPAAEDPHSIDHVLREIQAANAASIIELEGCREFVEEFLDSEPNELGAEFRDRVFSRTGGHPLFTVELVRGMQERGEIRRDRMGVWRARGPFDWNRLPPRVEAVIGQRIARLREPLQRDLEIASVQGEEFVAEVVSRVRGDPDAVGRLSAESVAPQRVIEPSGVTRLDARLASRHRFRHVFFQRYLYERLDAADRIRLHEATAQALEELYLDHADLPVVELARHYDEAGLVEPAIDYLRRSAQRALRMSAPEEAVGLLERARVLLASTPESTERDESELTLLSALFAALMSARGYASEEAEHIGRRVRELCDRLEPSATAALSLVGLASVLSVRGRYREALATATEAREISEALGDEAVSLAAHQVLGYQQTWMGDLAAGHANLQHAHESYDPDRHGWLIYAAGSAEGPDAMAWDAVNTLHRGYPDQARELADRAVAMARRIGHPFTLCHVVAIAEVVRRHFGGDFQTDSFIAEVGEIARSEHFPFYEGAVDIYRGWAAGNRGDPAAGAELLTRGLETWRSIDVEAFRPAFLGYRAWFEFLGDADVRALEAVDRALRLATRSGERISEVSVLLVRAKIMATVDPNEAMHALTDLMAQTRDIGLRLLELQAAIEQAQLLDCVGAAQEAEAALAPVYTRFTEGLDTPYLVAARSVLERL